jgi:hypothetical protein
VLKTRGLKWKGLVARKEEMRGAYRTLVGKTEEKIVLGRAMRRWKITLKGIFKK